MPTSMPANRFDPRQFLIGKVRAQGVFEDRTGKVRRRFTIDMNGRREADNVVVDEVFAFDDGEQQTRTWTFTPQGDRWTAVAGEVVGPAVGAWDGDIFRLNYRFSVSLGKRSVELDVSDRFIEIEPGLAINRSTFRKFGIRVGEVFATLRREDAIAGTAANDALREAAE